MSYTHTTEVCVWFGFVESSKNTFTFLPRKNKLFLATSVNKLKIFKDTSKFQSPNMEQGLFNKKESSQCLVLYKDKIIKVRMGLSLAP